MPGTTIVPEGHKGHYDGVIRNNVVWATVPYFDTGIGLEAAPGARVLHNTVLSTDKVGQFSSSIDCRFPTSVVTIQNNLTENITLREGATGQESHNKQATPLSYFANPMGVDFHLVAEADEAIDMGIALPDAGVDIYGVQHELGAGPDLGAAEFVPR
jgi:hypothetical protein